MRVIKNVGAVIMMTGGVVLGAGPTGWAVALLVLGFFPFVIGRMGDKA